MEKTQKYLSIIFNDVTKLVDKEASMELIKDTAGHFDIDITGIQRVDNNGSVLIIEADDESLDELIDTVKYLDTLKKISEIPRLD